MEVKPIIKIENIVATVTLDQALDLSAIARSVPNIEYDPEEFPGLIMRLESPRLTALVFNSGKMVVTGAKSTQMLIKGFKKIIRIFVRHGIIIVGKPKIQIQNIVASANLGVEVDLEKAAKQPHIVVAECSFLKAALYEDEETFIPYIVSRLSDLIPCGNTGRTRKIDDKLIIEVENAWEMHKKLNKSNYKVYTTKKELLEFFKKYKGKECYYLCW